MTASDREYQFKEWLALPEKERRTIIHGWNPYDPRVTTGMATRAAIVEAFLDQYAVLRNGPVEVAHFDKEGWCLAVIVPKRSTAVPLHFAGLRIVKGVGEPGDPIRWVRT